MKKFIFKILLFIAPSMVLFFSIELFLNFHPTTFNTKAKYINNNTDIEILFFGSSHTQNSINPEFFIKKTANLAYGGQDYAHDSILFFKYVPKLNHLKYVFLEIDYHSLDTKTDQYYFREPWYYRFYGTSVYNISFANKISLYKSSPTFFNKYFLRLINPKSYHYIINKYGFVTSDYPGSFKDFNYDTLSIEKTAKKRLLHRFRIISVPNFKSNKNILLSMINYCLNHNIKIVLLKNPVFKTLRETYIPEKEQRREALISNILMDKRIRLVDFENDKRFKVKDFKNDDHLNSTGAKKISLLLNNLIENKIRPHNNVYKSLGEK